MKAMKKLASVLLALVMVMSLTANVWGAEGDTYEIYQIFTGDYSEGILSNVKWGKNGTGTAGEAVAKDVLDALAAVKDASDAAQLDVITAYANLETEAFTTGTATTYENLPNGYYLVKNVDGSQEDEYGFYTLFVVKVVDNTLSFQPKGEAPMVDKEVDDNDANIGDTVTFTLTATMPSTFEGYETYKVIFHDTMSEGLTFGEITKVTVNGQVQETGFVLEPAVPVAGEEFTVTFADVLAMGAEAGCTVTVKYTATLNADAIIGTEGNPNEVYLEYSNNPNWDGTGDEPTGNTPKNEVKVYTWEIPVFKYTKDGETEKALAGAGFTLYDEGVEVKLTKVEDSNIYKVDPNGTVTQIVTDDSGMFEIEGLEQGTYVLKETLTPAGYNTCDNITVVIGEEGALTVGEEAVTTVKVLNQAGTVLPETGGMGTTILYIVGGVLVLAAVVLLVTKRRMKDSE